MSEPDVLKLLSKFKETFYKGGTYWSLTWTPREVNTMSRVVSSINPQKVDTKKGRLQRSSMCLRIKLVHSFHKNQESYIVSGPEYRGGQDEVCHCEYSKQFILVLPFINYCTLYSY